MHYTAMSWGAAFSGDFPQIFPTWCQCVCPLHIPYFPGSLGAASWQDLAVQWLLAMQHDPQRPGGRGLVARCHLPSLLRGAAGMEPGQLAPRYRGVGG